MTNDPNNPDLRAIAHEAEAELMIAEAVETADQTSGVPARAFATAELGYYEAELTSLCDAATTLEEAEHPPE